MNPTYFKLTLADGSAYEVDSNTYASSLNSFQAVSDVQPGEKVKGGCYVLGPCKWKTCKTNVF